MEKTAWANDLEIGIPELDAQHRNIARIISDVQSVAASGEDRAGLIRMLKQARDGIREHFVLEEKYMDEHLYPELEGHRQLHAEFMKEFDIMVLKASRGETGAKYAAELKERVGDWFILHIRKNDVKMASFMHRK